MKDPTRIREPGSDVPEDLRELFRAAKRPEPLTPDALPDWTHDSSLIGWLDSLGH